MSLNDKNISYLSSCKICGNTNLKNVIKLNEQYISATFVKSNKKNDLKKIKTPLTLSLCDQSKKNTTRQRKHKHNRIQKLRQRDTQTER